MATATAFAPAGETTDRRKMVVAWKTKEMNDAGWPVVELLNSRMGPTEGMSEEKVTNMVYKALAALYVEFRQAKEKKAAKAEAAEKMGLNGEVINAKALRIFRRNPEGLGVRWGSVTASEDEFSDSESDGDD